MFPFISIEWTGNLSIGWCSQFTSLIRKHIMVDVIICIHEFFETYVHFRATRIFMKLKIMTKKCHPAYACGDFVLKIITD